MLLRTCTLLVVVAACAGCGRSADQTSSSTTDPRDSTTSSRPQEDGFTTVDPSDPNASLPVYLDEDLIGQVRALASEEAGVEPDAFEVEVAAEVTWSDGSLGCPEPGRAYTQALVDGYWVVVTHESATFDYRAGREADFGRCIDGSPPASIHEES